MPCRELRFVLSVVFYVVSENPQNCIGSKSCRNQKKTPENPKISGVVLSGGFNSDIFASEALHCNGLQISNKKYSQFFEVLLTQFEPPSEFNTSITRPAFETHPAAVLASILPLSADR